LQTRHWDDKEGQKRSSVEVVANEMTFLSERRESGSNHEAGPAAGDDNAAPAANEDEFPF
jgi:single-stranded DNA-binding protein